MGNLVTASDHVRNALLLLPDELRGLNALKHLGLFLVAISPSVSAESWKPGPELLDDAPDSG
jgi:hypothetical protein